MKEYEGKDVYLIGTGNRARGNTQKYIKEKVTKVARVFVHLILDGYTIESKYRYNGLVLSDGHNGGYLVSGSIKEIDEYYETIDITDRISEKYRYRSDFSKLDIAKLRKIAKLLEV